jgi:hypothetical protein
MLGTGTNGLGHSSTHQDMFCQPAAAAAPSNNDHCSFYCREMLGTDTNGLATATRTQTPLQPAAS